MLLDSFKLTLRSYPKFAAIVPFKEGSFTERGERVCAVLDLRSADEALSFVEMQEHRRGEGWRSRRRPSSSRWSRRCLETPT